MFEERSNVNTSDDFAQPQIFHSRFGRVTYENPTSFKGWGGLPKIPAVLKWKLDAYCCQGIPSEDILDEELPIIDSDFSNTSGLKATWLGHATVLVQMNGVNFITDPVLSPRASPTNFAGPKRYRPPPCGIDQYPEIKFAVISHNHYDHLDAEAVKGLNKRFPEMLWYVPVGLKGWMNSTIPGAEIHEMIW